MAEFIGVYRRLDTGICGLVDIINQSIPFDVRIEVYGRKFVVRGIMVLEYHKDGEALRLENEDTSPLLGWLPKSIIIYGDPDKCKDCEITLPSEIVEAVSNCNLFHLKLRNVLEVTGISPDTEVFTNY